MLTELSKANAPSLLLHEFNYYFNKAINQYINKRYNIYDINQQTTDDLRVLKATAILKPRVAENYDSFKQLGAGAAKLFMGTYEVILPDDYLHMLNCVCIYKMLKDHKCYNAGDYVDFSAKRLTADSWSIILNDYYNRPLPERPYYYIHDVNQNAETAFNSTNLPTNKFDPAKPGSTDQEWTGVADDEAGYTKVAEYPRTIKLDGTADTDVVEKVPGLRYANPSKVRCEIRYGRDNTVYLLDQVFIDYIKAPQVIRLTKEQVDLTEDTSQLMEFPDYVCQEIINELTTLVMARDADPRLQVNTQVTQSIANPAQQ